MALRSLSAAPWLVYRT